MIKGVQTKDKKPLLTIDDIQLYVLELEHENRVLREKYNKEHKQICKAIEFMNNYNELVIPEANIKSLVLKEEYKKIISILQGVDKDE